MLWARRPMAWWARLRADLILAMSGFASERARILA
jgi:hypothetical protein